MRIAWLAAALGAVLAVVGRLPFLRAPLTADEGGYAEVARLWSRSWTLYGSAWVDRPQGLVLTFRGALAAGLGSTAGLRSVAAAVAAMTVLVVFLLTRRLAGPVAAAAAALLLGTLGASPWIESFTLQGELIAALPAAAAVLAYSEYAVRRRLQWLVAAGLLAGAAPMVKQSALDGFLAIAALLAWTRAWRPLAVFVAASCAPVAAAALSTAHPSAWWFAVVRYRAADTSLFAGSFAGHLQAFADSLPAAARALGPLVLLAALAGRRSPTLVRLWLAGAVVGILGGGAFHPHYYVQLVPPLAVLGGIGVARLLEAHRPLAFAALGTAAVAALAVTVPLWLDSPSAQARTIWPRDTHLLQDAAVARYVDAHTARTQRALVLWAAADVYYLADRAPAQRYLWFSNLRDAPGALAGVRRALRARTPALVAIEQPLGLLDGGAERRILGAEYRRVAVVDGVRLYRPLR
jgi:4-amino-4-deoxy-L-arabinose transferase-like glycosyltransferase